MRGSRYRWQIRPHDRGGEDFERERHRARTIRSRAGATRHEESGSSSQRSAASGMLHRTGTYVRHSGVRERREAAEFSQGFQGGEKSWRRRIDLQGSYRICVPGKQSSFVNL